MIKNLEAVLTATLMSTALVAMPACDDDGGTETDDSTTAGTTAGCPGTSAGCPGTSAGCPGTSAGCPGTSAGCPGTSAGCPGTSAGCPGTSAGCPGTTAGCPGTTAGCPAIPGSGDDTPNCEDVCTKRFECGLTDGDGFVRCQDNCLSEKAPNTEPSPEMAECIMGSCDEVDSCINMLRAR